MKLNQFSRKLFHLFEHAKREESVDVAFRKILKFTFLLPAFVEICRTFFFISGRGRIE